MSFTSPIAYTLVPELQALRRDLASLPALGCVLKWSRFIQLGTCAREQTMLRVKSLSE
jgi:hypothetical protein